MSGSSETAQTQLSAARNGLARTVQTSQQSACSRLRSCAVSLGLLVFYLGMCRLMRSVLLFVRVLLASVRIGTGFELECRGLGNFPAERLAESVRIVCKDLGVITCA